MEKQLTLSSIVVVERVTSLDIAELDPLIRESVAEGFGFIQRLSDDYVSGKHRFDGPRDALFTIHVDGELAAVGGFTPDTYSGDPLIGRVRRVYVLATYRRCGLGRVLLAEILKAAGEHFETVVLRTDTERAAAFYRSLGFEETSEFPDATHVMRLGQARS